jgi:hypothetical protein
MPSMGLEPTISAFEPAKTVHALDYAATVIGHKSVTNSRKTEYVSNEVMIFRVDTNTDNKMASGNSCASCYGSSCLCAKGSISRAL